MSKKVLLMVAIIVSILAACRPLNTPPTGEAPPGKARGNFYINDVQLRIMESYPIQVALDIDGEMPTPCHEFSYSIAEPNEKNEIHIEMFTLVNEGEVCVEVIQPVQTNVSIPLTDKPDGSYSVWVNGETVGEFSYPGG